MSWLPPADGSLQGLLGSMGRRAARKAITAALEAHHDTGDRAGAGAVVCSCCDSFMYDYADHRADEVLKALDAL